jgi:hypothetical protein
MVSMRAAVLLLSVQPRDTAAEITETNPERMPQQKVLFAIAIALGAWTAIIGGISLLL